MDFYGRETELALLERFWKMTDKRARMMVITGNRRIGKTLLSTVFSRDKPHLYLFVAKKSEILLCQEFMKQIREGFDVPPLGEMTCFRDIFALLLELGKKTPFVLVIDEIQEFLTINPSIFSDMQNLWDSNLFVSKVELILMGSIYSLMHRIFEDSHEPLFGRADRIIRLKPFPVSQIAKILTCYNQGNQIEVLFNYYLFTGGMPKYIDQLLSEGVFLEEDILNFFLSDTSPFIHEGKMILVEEFGKEYGMYFSILELIASGKSGRSEIESIIQKDVGGHLERLENYYGVIEKNRSIHAKAQSRSLKYQIKNLFLRFWFRFIYRNWSAIETGNYHYVRRVIAQSLPTYKGFVLEDFFKNIFKETTQYNHIGSYWEHDHSNEIDLVMINDLEKKIVVAEIKTNKDRIRLGGLKIKSEGLLKHYPGYSPEYLMLGPEDAYEYLR